MEEPITRAEYEEYQKRIEDEDHRQNRRIEQLEGNTKQINALTVSIEKLAQSVESMVKEQEAQGKYVQETWDNLETKDRPAFMIKYFSVFSISEIENMFAQMPKEYQALKRMDIRRIFIQMNSG